MVVERTPGERNYNRSTSSNDFITIARAVVKKNKQLPVQCRQKYVTNADDDAIRSSRAHIMASTTAAEEDYDTVITGSKADRCNSAPSPVLMA